MHNHLMVDLPPASYRDDIQLTTAANNALAQNVSLSHTLEAAADAGDVWLTGWVGNGAQRNDAEMTIAPLAGVRGIIDDITVVPVHDGGGTADTTERISEALQRYAVFDDDSAINVQADSGTTSLSGHVSTWEEHDAAIQAAWMGQGVKEVRDQMAVTGGW